MSAFDPYDTDLMITVQLRKHCDINENRLFFFTRSLSPLLPQSCEWVGTGVDRIRPCDQSERGGDNEDRRVKDYTPQWKPETNGGNYFRTFCNSHTPKKMANTYWKVKEKCHFPRESSHWVSGA